MHEFHVTHMLTLLLTSKGPLVIHPPLQPSLYPLGHSHNPLFLILFSFSIHSIIPFKFKEYPKSQSGTLLHRRYSKIAWLFLYCHAVIFTLFLSSLFTTKNKSKMKAG